MTTDYLGMIKRFEGFAARATWDYSQHTNGYGTRARHAGEVIGPEEAERRFSGEIAAAQAFVDRVAPEVDDGTRAALSSLTFNTGTRWAKSGLGDAIRRGDLVAARDLFLQYDKAGGEPLAGLTKRRAIEAGWIGIGSGSASSGWAVSQDAASTDPPTLIATTSRTAPRTPQATSPGPTATLPIGPGLCEVLMIALEGTRRAESRREPEQSASPTAPA